MDLAIPKKAWLIRIGNESITVMMDNNTKEADRLEMKRTKAIVSIDWYVFDCAFIAYIKAISPTDDTAQTALAYARSLSGWLQAVAMQMCSIYRQNHNTELPLNKLITRLWQFQSGKDSRWDSLLDFKPYLEYYSIYLSAWGDPSLIFNYKQNNDLWA